VFSRKSRLHARLPGTFLFSILFAAASSLRCVYQHPIDNAAEQTCDNEDLNNRTHPHIGNYTVFYGGFHSHSGFSPDARGTPEDAYRYARCVAGLDFFGLSDHDKDLTLSRFDSVKAAADRYNADGFFAALWGFEWSSYIFGHVTVVGTKDFASSTDPQTQTFQQLCSWLLARNCFAILNHPGEGDKFRPEFDHFQGPACDKIVGVELWNLYKDFRYYYYAGGYDSSDDSKGYYDEALSHGWKIGAAGGFDDHYGTWGTINDWRVAVLAHELTRQDIFDAMTARRFYSTLDKNIALSFAIAGREMGSTIPAAVALPLAIRATDGDGEIYSEVVVFDRNHAVRRAWIIDAASVAIDDTLIVANGDYYYVKITQRDGDEAISSPIWISDTR
jgi:hypothetical protein